MVFGGEDPNQVLTTVGYLEEKSLNTQFSLLIITCIVMVISRTKRKTHTKKAKNAKKKSNPFEASSH